MSGYFGGGSSAQNNATAIGTLNLQTSCYGKSIPWAFGTVRVPPNLIQYEDFTAIAHTSSQSAGGKGGHGSSSSTTYTYTAAAIMALVSGPIVGVPRAWKDKDVTTLGKLVLDLYTGSATQMPYPYMQTKHPDRALGYRGISYVAAGAYDLGNSATLGNHSFEVQTSARIAGLPDANPADVIKAIVTDTEQGVGMPAPSVGDLTQFSNFCLANGIWVSPLYKEQKPAFENIKNLLQIGFADCYRSSGVLNIVPYSDSAASSAYGNFIPASTAPIAITEDDILDVGDDPLLMTRKAQSESFNHVQVRFSDRSDDYNDNIAEAKDQADIEVFGIRSMPVVEMKEICDVATATKVAEFLLHRSLHIRNEYEFSLPWKFVYLEPMDQLAIYYPRKGHNGTVVMITEITEDEDGMLTVKAEEYPLGTNRVSTKSPPTTNGYTPNFSVDPGNATVPVIFEAPLQLTNNVPQVWMAVAGGANWGGCDVWASTDNASYQKIGRMQQKSRYGTTTTAIASGAAIDTVSNLGVNLNVSAGVLTSGTQQNAQDMITRCYVDGEYISYATATLTGVNTYSLSYLVRGGYGTDDVPHAAGVPFVRLDDGLFTYDYPKEWVGKTIYIKLVSFNAFGGGLQDISAVQPATYTIVGAPLGVVQNLRMATSWSSGKNASIAWDSLPGASTYDVQFLAGTPATVVRSLTGLVSNQTTYTPQDMRADGGPWRALSVNVRGRSITGAVGHWATILASNPQIGALTNVSMTAGIKTGYFKCTPPPDDDFAGVIVWLSTDPNCPPIDANKVYDGSNTFVTLNQLADGTGLVAGTNYYFRAAGYDTFGKDSLTISTAVQFIPSANAPDANTIQASMIKDGALTLTKFASGLQPVGVVNGLPVVSGYTGPTVVTNSVDGKLYRLVGGAWTSAVPTTDLSGQLTDAQLGAISAAKVTGQLNDTQLAAISAAKVAGQLNDTQLAAISAVKVTGQLVTTQIASAAITADKLGVVLGGGNLTPNSSFENVPAGGALATGWNVYNNSANVAAYSAMVPGRLSGVAQQIYWTTNNDGNTKGIYGSVCPPGWQAGKTYVLSFYATTTNLSIATTLGLYFNISPATVTALQNPVLNTSWQRYSFRLTWGANVEASGRVCVSIANWAASIGNIIFDDFQLTEGDMLTGYAPMVGEILPNAVGSLQIAANAVTAAKTALAAIDPSSGNLTANSVTATQIAAGAVTAIAIQAGSITGDRLAANTIGANQIAAGSITGDRLQANTVTASQIDSRNLTIRDGAGNVIFAAGTPLTASNITPAAGWLNSNVTVDGNGVLQGAGSTVQVANNQLQNSVLHIKRPQGASGYGGPGAINGSIKIRLPQGFSNTMLRFTVDIFEYSTNASASYDVGGYNYAIDLRWYNAFARFIGPPGFARPVYFGHDGNYACIWIGDPSGNWSYPNVQVHDFVAGYSNINENQWATGWQVSWDTGARVSTSASITNPVAGGALSGVDQITAGNAPTYIANAAIQDAQIGNLSGNKIVANTITASQLAAGAVTAATVAAGAITTPAISAGAVTATQVAAGSITGDRLAANTITAGNMQAGSVTAAALAAGAVTAGTIAAGAITTPALSAGVVTAQNLAAGSVTANAIAANSITTAAIQAGAVTANQIAAGAITASKMYIGAAGTNVWIDPTYADSSAWQLCNWGQLPQQWLGGGNAGDFMSGSSAMLAWAWTTSVRGAFRVPVTPGALYKVSAWVKSTVNTDGTFWLRVDAGSSRTGAYGENTIGVEGVAAVTDSVWHQYVGYFTPSSSQTWASPMLILNYNGTAGWMMANDIRIEQVLPGTLIQDGAISTAKLTAGAVTADKILANTITSTQIAVNSITGDRIQAGSVSANIFSSGIAGNNLLDNSAFAATYLSNGVNYPDGYSTGSNIINPSEMTMGVNLIGALYHPPGISGLVVCQAGTSGQGNASAYYDVYSPVVPCSTGQWMETSFYSGAYRCTVSGYLAFCDANGNALSYVKMPDNTGVPAGTTLSTFYRHSIVAQAPNGTVTCRLLFRKLPTNAGQPDSYMMIQCPMIAAAMSGNQTAPSPWSPAGIGTQISGGVIKANSVTVDKLAVTSLSAITATIGTLRTAATGARTEISDNVIRVFDQNGTMRVKLGNLAL
ncbi:phage tail protein [Undibacterium sp. SXout11W]|uniref:phage tail protein n=1 Tax=Undibacterium sp. SXout11W TaxID=3413050 RepID=UPI003BF0BF33